MSDLIASHIQIVSRKLGEGRVIPFLGAGAGVCDRPRREAWAPGKELPSGRELTDHIGKDRDYCSGFNDLTRVAQFVELMEGSGSLYESLWRVFSPSFAPTSVHRLLASIPSRTRFPLVIVTTNYDRLAEQAFEQAGIDYDLIYYSAAVDRAGVFIHRAPDGTEASIDAPNKYDAVDPARRSVILKVHGTVDPAASPEQSGHRNSFVITENHYVDYLSQADAPNLLPVLLAARMKTSHFLFLGYALRDWNLRVFLRRLWKDRNLKWNHWAIRAEPDQLETLFWRAHHVETHVCELSDYSRLLEAALPRPGEAAPR